MKETVTRQKQMHERKVQDRNTIMTEKMYERNSYMIEMVS